MIFSNIKRTINEALKSGDKVRVSTLRMLSSALHNASIDKRGDLTEDEELVVVQKEAKKRKEAIEVYEKINDETKLKQEAEELAILEEFLPEQLSDEEIKAIVIASINKTGAKSMADMGKVIGLVMKEAKGAADGKRVSEIVKSKLG